MNNIKEKLIEEFNQHKGEFVITKLNVVQKLVGLVDDGEDYYYVYYDGRFDLPLMSCVMGNIYLKGKIDDRDYDELVRIDELNDINRLFDGDKKSELKNIFLERIKSLNTTLISDDLYL